MDGNGDLIESAAQVAREGGIGHKAKQFRRALRTAGIPKDHIHGEHYRYRRGSPEHQQMQEVARRFRG